MDFPSASNVPGSTIRSKDLSNGVDGGSAEENGFDDAVLKYINQVLMEDDLEDEACMIQDTTLHAAEKSLYDVLNKKYPSSPDQHLTDESRSSSSDDSITHCCSNICNSCVNAYNSSDSGLPSDNQSGSRFEGGLEKSKNIVPSVENGNFDFEKSRLTPPAEAKEKVPNVEAEVEKDEGDSADRLLGERKILHQEERDLEEGRSSKHCAVSADESILHQMFDKVFSNESALNTIDGPLPNERAKVSNVEMTYGKKGVRRREAVDMRSLLIECMQSVANNDHRRSSKLLKQIRLRSSPFGDGSQRLAHYFANSLEARLAGARNLEYKALSARSLSDADLMKAYKMYLTAFPFMETSYFFAAETIMELITEKATSVHIVHFGIMNGLQWPPLIQRLSKRLGGPPKLRITGIDLPLAGFWPDARVKATGCRLANHCERFNVPFQYNGIAQKWETINVEDLGIEKDEVLVVNCFYHFMYLLDDTIMEDSPRDAVLNLIKRINPDIFIHGIVNGTYNSPLFISRFREALFYFSTMFDMFEANVPRESHERMVFEREILGKEIMNIITCEGLERIERPETFKQWQIRTLRAGFTQLPLNQEMMKKIRAKVKSSYHKDIFVEEASQWMLEGWKGRVLVAYSCWKPAQLRVLQIG